MRSSVPLVVCALALAGGAAACGPATPPPPGVLTVTFTPTTVSSPVLTLSSASMRLDNIVAIGDTPPPPPGMPMPLAFDGLSPAGVARVLDKLPPGLYSRVQLNFDTGQVAGTWRGTPFTARFAPFRGPPVQIRSATGYELAHGMDVTMPVTVDLDGWFANGLLDEAMPAGGTITIDDTQNQLQQMQLTDNVARSFSLP